MKQHWLRARLRGFGCEFEMAPDVDNRLNIKGVVTRKRRFGRRKEEALQVQVTYSGDGSETERGSSTTSVPNSDSMMHTMLIPPALAMEMKSTTGSRSTGGSCSGWQAYEENRIHWSIYFSYVVRTYFSKSPS